jgi:HEPN domain-containing protein
LCLNEIEIPKTHDIRRLIQLAKSYCTELELLKDDADKLSVCAVISRYPDAFSVVTKENLDAILIATRRFADILLPYLVYGNQ